MSLEGILNMVKYGYIDTYTVDPSTGLYSCQVNTIDEGSFNKEIQSVLTPIVNSGNNAPSANLTLNALSKVTKPTTVTTNAVLIPIKMPSSYNVASPNDPGQMIMMSRDNKYIFINIMNLKNEQLLNEIYLFLSTSLKFQIPIPSIKNMYILMFGSIIYEPVDDGTYGKLANDTEMNKRIKSYYKMYLISNNPPPFLLSYNSDATVWKNISYYMKAWHDATSSNMDTSKFCLNIAMDKQPESTISCNSRQDASDNIVPSFSLTDISSIYNSHPYWIFGCLAVIILCSCCMSLMVLSKK